MANKSFSRGVEIIGAEAAMVFIGNTRHTLPYMLKHTDLFDELPEQYYDSAFLDRIHFYLPGWEVDIIRGEMFSDGYGFVVDYLAEILRSLRNNDYSDQYSQHFNLVSDISTRDKDGINKTFSGLMKILFPHKEATKKEIEEVLQFAIEGRKRVKDQLMKIDSTYAAVRFAYTENDGNKTILVKSLEEEEYPQYFSSSPDEESDLDKDEQGSDQPQAQAVVNEKPPELKERQVIVKENQRGVTYDKLFGQYLQDAKKITVTDSYIRIFYQIRNLMEFLETVATFKPKDDEVEVHLITVEDEFKGPQQIEFFIKIQENCAIAGVQFTWEFDETQTLHARHIVTDHGWKILLDRGLDIFQHYEMNDSFSLSNRLQQYRSCKAFEITYLKADG